MDAMKLAIICFAVSNAVENATKSSLMSNTSSEFVAILKLFQILSAISCRVLFFRVQIIPSRK